jgi:hypothetical protein
VASSARSVAASRLLPGFTTALRNASPSSELTTVLRVIPQRIAELLRRITHRSRSIEDETDSKNSAREVRHRATPSSDESSTSTVWPQKALEAQTPFIAAKIGRLMSEPREWVERRVEGITFVDDTTMRRYTSVHLVVPDFAERAPADLPDVSLTHVPLALIEKGLLVNLDVLDEGGRSLPVLTKRQNGRIAAEILIQRARLLVRQKRNEELAPALEYALEDLAGFRDSTRPELTPEGGRAAKAVCLRVTRPEKPAPRLRCELHVDRAP